jgi:hypothetical protein
MTSVVRAGLRLDRQAILLGAIAADSMSPRPCHGSECRSRQPSACNGANARWTASSERAPTRLRRGSESQWRAYRPSAAATMRRHIATRAALTLAARRPRSVVPAAPIPASPARADGTAGDRVVHAATASSSHPAASPLSPSVGSAIARSSHCQTVLPASGIGPSYDPSSALCMELVREWTGLPAGSILFAGTLPIPLPGFELCCEPRKPSVYRLFATVFTRWGQLGAA